ncbi:MAG: hypothetical protein KF861_13720, partial [Planctomycetaceae bacterium]|nr:hypothetical protein [Planctomycetaceae bacterium]
SFAHIYTEADLLNNTGENYERDSSVSNVIVRFSVSQHPSIVIKADTVTQNGVTVSTANPADNYTGLATSTDLNRLPGKLESGRVSFLVGPIIIAPPPQFEGPELPEIEVFEAIPVAPLPVPDPVVTLNEQTVSSSTVAGREEYFELRVVSPDPREELLTRPERLPDDILSQNRLEVLFSTLPDGTYEIDYVLGEGNVRTILRVEIHQGRASLVGQDQESGPLILEEIKQRLRDAVEELGMQQDAAGDSDVDPANSPVVTQGALMDPQAVIPPPGELSQAATPVAGTMWAAPVVVVGAAAKRLREKHRNPYSTAGRFARRLKQPAAV